VYPSIFTLPANKVRKFPILHTAFYIAGSGLNRYKGKDQAMKTFFCLGIVILFQFASAYGDDRVGRYQLVAGSYGSSAETQRTGIIKIDTVTGDTWELVVSYFPVKGSNNTKGQIDVVGWAPVASNIADQIQKLRSAGALPK
jgi:hypothetical protein